MISNLTYCPTLELLGSSRVPVTGSLYIVVLTPSYRHCSYSLSTFLPFLESRL